MSCRCTPLPASPLFPGAFGALTISTFLSGNPLKGNRGCPDRGFHLVPASCAPPDRRIPPEAQEPTTAMPRARKIPSLHMEERAIIRTFDRHGEDVATSKQYATALDLTSQGL